MRRRVPRHHPFLPFLATFAAVGLLALMDALMKGAALSAGAFTASFARSGIAALFAVPLWLAAGGTWPAKAVLRIHLKRGVVTAFMALSFFYALTKLPIAETIAISFIAPLVALWLAAWLLGEVVQRRAVGAALLGLAGTLVIVGGRIGRERMTEDAALGLAAILFSAMLYAWNLVIQREQALVAKPLEVASFHSGVGFAVHAIFAPFLFAAPDGEALVRISLAALLTVGGSISLAWAYARAEAQTLVPIEYSGFIWAALFGWLFFEERVTATTAAGTLLIIVGCWVATRRRRTMPAP